VPDRPIVVITDYDYGNVDVEREILEAAGATVIALQAKTEPELFEHAVSCAAMMNQYARIGADTIARMTQCQVIARYGVGVDIVDVQAASARNILVTNVRDYCTEEVADHAIALWLSLARRLFDYDRATKAGVWQWQSGKPILSERARAFGVDIIAYDPYLSAEIAQQHGATLVDKPTLLKTADYLLMQAPMNEDTRHFLSDAEFNAMKPGAIVVNTGRGPTIDNAALYRALTDGTLLAAGLDDPEEEPAKRAVWSPDDNPLFSLPNVVVTPHSAYYSEQSIQTARETAASEVARVLTNQPPRYPVNADQLTAK